MLMKKRFILFLCTLPSLVAISQNSQDAKRFIYYERYKSAEDLLQQLVKTDAENAENWYLLSKAYLSLEDPAPLQNMLSLAPASLKGEPYFQVAYGSYLLNKGNKDSARYYFDQALDKTREKNAGILSAIANSHIVAKTGDANYAVELLSKAVNREKKDPALFTMLGDAQRKQGNGSKAYKSYVAALDKDGRHAAALYRMGKIFVSQKNPEMYLKYFNQTLEIPAPQEPANRTGMIWGLLL